MREEDGATVGEVGLWQQTGSTSSAFEHGKLGSNYFASH